MAYVFSVAVAGSWRAPKQPGGSTMVRGRTLHRAIGSTTGAIAVALALAKVSVAANDDYVIQLT